MRSAIKKNALREIKKSLGRYIAILAIIALGVGFFAGLKVTKPSMIRTAENYISDSAMYDIKMISTLGFTSDDVTYFQNNLDNVYLVDGAYTTDFVFQDTMGIERVIRAHSVTGLINKLTIVAGNNLNSSSYIPIKEQCLADANYFTEKDIGKTITISDPNGNSALAVKSFTIVGLVNSPCYMNIERGTTSLGNGSVSAFIYLPSESFTLDYYTELYIKLSYNVSPFSDDYGTIIDNTIEKLDNLCVEAAQNRYDSLIDAGQAAIDKSEIDYKTALALYNVEYQTTIESLAEEYQQLIDAKASVQAMYDENEAKLAELEQQRIETNAKIAEIDVKLRDPAYSGGYADLQAARAKYSSLLLQISLSKNTATTSKVTLMNQLSEIDSKISGFSISQALTMQQLENTKKDIDNLALAIEEAKVQLSLLEKPEMYSLSRSLNAGFSCFESDSSIVEGIAKIFPIFFFLIAALVCVTTLTRMVDEQRTQIGTFKALGYSNVSITGKYMFYSASAATIGCIAGFFLGSWLFPKAIWHAYSMLYLFADDVVFVFDPILAAISLAVALLCSLGATFVACYGTLKGEPAVLIRPKAPAAGKRILLERMGFIWNHLSFLRKISFRNIFRYKKRFWMMVLGIAGCTALVLTGFGIRDSISNIVKYQFDEITKYDFAVSFSDGMSSEDQDAFKTQFSDQTNGIEFVYQSSTTIDIGKTVKSVNLVAFTNANISDFVDLHNDKGSIAFPGVGEAVINSKLASIAGLSVGDTITLRDSKGAPISFRVSDICDNYVYNFAFVSYQSISGYDIKTAYVNAATNLDVYSVAAQVMNYDGVASVSVNLDTRDRVENTMEKLDFVVWLVIACAGALGLIVLFNLSNINITERVREIATIKVLGFYPGETGAYVFRENFVLTLVGTILGLPCGILLHRFVMSQISIDLVSFDVRIAPLSYLWAILFTFVVTIVVDLMMRGKLNKIKMAESLKSIE